LEMNIFNGNREELRELLIQSSVPTRF
jgi:hypothetical protein